MNAGELLNVKLIHCGNINIAYPQDRGEKNIFVMPMGLFALADSLKKYAADIVDVEIIHLDLEAGKLIEEILDFENLDMVGFDCHWVNQSLVVMQTTELIKRIKPGVFIFLGGYTASLFAGEIISGFPHIDCIIRGDGEVPIVELCKSLHRERKNPVEGLLNNVQNLAWRDENHNLRLNELSYVGTAEEMSKLDFAAIDLLRNWEGYRAACPYYSHFRPFAITPVFYLEVGRGCQYACTFCGGNCEAQKRISNRKQTVMRTIDSVIKTIKKAMSFGYKTFYTCIEHDNSDDWYIGLFHRLVEENMKVNFCYGSWRLPSQALIDALSQSCDQALFEISAETADHHIRKKNKDPRLFYTNAQLEKCLEYISQKKNIKVQLYFGYYLAFDTRKAIFNTIRFALNLLIKYHWFLEIDYHNLSTDPASLFFFFPEKYQLQYKPRNFEDYLESLGKNYQEQKGQPADMTLFRPMSIQEEEDSFIRMVMKILVDSFVLYKKSISYILAKTGDADIIMEFLEKVARIPAISDPHLRSQIIRDNFIKISKAKNILDLSLSKMIYSEYEKQKTIPRGTKATTFIYMDLEKEDNEKKSLLLPKNIIDEEDFDFSN